MLNQRKPLSTRYTTHTVEPLALDGQQASCDMKVRHLGPI